jgi:hypothetical protein
MNRRNFLSNGVVIGLASPFIATKAIVDFARTRKEPLKETQVGDILTADFMNEIVSRINELESKI